MMIKEKMTFNDLRERKVIPVDSYGSSRYVIAIGDIGSAYFLVHAYHLQEAIDFIVDEMGDNYPGFFAEEEMVDAYYDNDHEDYDYMNDMYFPAGNASELFTSEIHVLYEDNKGRR